MSETRCKEYKGVEAKSCKETVAAFSFNIKAQRRKALIEKLRANKQRAAVTNGENDRFPEPDITQEELDELYREYLETCSEEPMELEDEESLQCPLCASELMLYNEGLLKCETEDCLCLHLPLPKESLPEVIKKMQLIVQSHVYSHSL